MLEPKIKVKVGDIVALSDAFYEEAGYFYLILVHDFGVCGTKP